MFSPSFLPICCLAALLLTPFFSAGGAAAMGQRPEEAQIPGEANPASSIPDMEESAGHLIHLGPRLTFQTARGPVVVVTFPKEAPKAVEQIVKLVESGFYNGLAFHRVVPGFVVQVGDPLTRTVAATDPKVGRGGSGQNLPPEFQGQTVKHLQGTLGMARGADPGSGDSQFYVTLAPSPHLDGRYTVWGQVVKGMDALRQVQPGDRITGATVNKPPAPIK